MKKIFIAFLLGVFLFSSSASAFTYKFFRVDADSQPEVIQPYLVSDPVPIDHGGTGVTSLSSLTVLLGIDDIVSDIANLVTALAGKEPTITTGSTGQYYRGDKTWQTLDKSAVGLGNVDNTSDAGKPISTAQQTALNGKQDLDSDLTAIAALSPTNDDLIQRKSGAWTNRTPAQFKTDLSLTKFDVGLGNVDNTSDVSKTFSTSQIISGTFADARISQSSVTQHQAALSIASSQVTGTKTSSYISDFNEAAQDATGSIMLGSNGVVVTYNDGANTIGVAGPARTFSNPARSLNNCFQISSTQDAFVSYSVDISSTLSLTTGQTGTVFLEYSDNNTCSTNTKEASRFVNGNTGTLTIGLNLTQNVTGTLTGMVPAGKYVQIRTANTSGTPTFTYRSAQEVLF